jgi:hypothetical protein
MEELNSQRFFELADVLRQGRLRDVQGFRGAGDVKQASGGYKVTKLAIFNHAEPPSGRIISKSYEMPHETVLDIITAKRLNEKRNSGGSI